MLLFRLDKKYIYDCIYIYLYICVCLYRSIYPMNYSLHRRSTRMTDILSPSFFFLFFFFFSFFSFYSKSFSFVFLPCRRISFFFCFFFLFFFFFSFVDIGTSLASIISFLISTVADFCEQVSSTFNDE